MRIPKAVKGKHKIRDCKILSLYATDNISMEEIGQKFGLTNQRVHQIIYQNRELLAINRQWEETKQIHRIQNHIRKAPQSKKDVHDWEALLDGKLNVKRVEHSGDAAGGHTKVIIIRESNGNQNQGGTVPGQVSIQRV